MWTYIKHGPDAERLPGQPALPAGPMLYHAFDALRWKRVIGVTEDGGYSAYLAPHVSDDCAIIAFAPLTEPTAPDEALLREAWPQAPAYEGSHAWVPPLLLQ